jgi:hypothetical protein
MRNREYPLISHDRRGHTRTTVNYEIDFEYYALDGKKIGSGHGETMNVGAGGLLMLTDEPLEVTMQVVVQIITPLTMFIARGAVVHAQAVDEDLYRAGIQFTDMINAEWELGVGGTAPS